jgi:homoserine dehydrogenase
LSREPLCVAMLGAGTVGRAVADGFVNASDRLLSADGAVLTLTGVAVRDLDRARAAGIRADLLTDAPAHLVADPEIDVIVEVMGGDEPARTLIVAALRAGKAVVTANKHVIAHHGPDLEAAARQTGAPLRFEAAVAGGIPVLGLIASDLAANEIARVRGIVNGTTNYILTAMAQEGQPYDDVLQDAQELGYAEADPTGDVEGDDAVNKLVILARLAFGTWIDPADVSTVAGAGGPGGGRPGITGVTSADIEAAASDGFVIKLIASARRSGDGIEASVLPTLVARDSALGRTAGVLNRIEIEAEPVGTVAFAGPGAGGAATSSAVLGDLLALAREAGSTWAGLPIAGRLAPLAR